jgi:stage III sporulation protein AA
MEEIMKELEEILKYFTENIRNEILIFFQKNEKYISEVQEIRIRANKPIIIKIGQASKILKYIVNQEEVLEIFEKICENSIYSYRKQICEGFITVKGGHRIGISGSCVMEENKIININYISSLNFRIAREKIDSSNCLLEYVLDKENNKIYNTLLVSPPGGGKTTMLRDFIRKISNGIKEIEFKGKTVGLVDERGEIAAIYKGVPQNDVGIRTDIIDNVTKAKGMQMLVRSMAPEIITCDEIGVKEDIEAINYAICCGIKGIFTAHGGSLEELVLNPVLSELFNKHIFERIIFLDTKIKGKIDKAYTLDKETKEYVLIK